MLRKLAVALLLLAACRTAPPVEPPQPAPAPQPPPVAVASREAAEPAPPPMDLAALSAAAHRRTAPPIEIGPRPTARATAGRESVPSIAESAPTVVRPRVIFGTSYEDLRPITEIQAHALKSLGFDVARPTIPWYKVHRYLTAQEDIRRNLVDGWPSQHAYDWTDVDQDIYTLHAAGFLIVPTVTYAPAWASGGKPTYQRYTDGCTRFKPGATSVMEIELDPTKPWCIDPPHIWLLDDPHPRPKTPEAWLEHSQQWPSHSPSYLFGAQLGKRYGRIVWAWAIGNEPKMDIYWPPMRLDDGMARLMVELIEPMTRGIRVHAPKSQFVGPEADSAGANAELLELEHRLGLQVFDAHTIHPYPWSENWEHVYVRIKDEFLPAIAPFRGNRPIWYSESGGMPDILVFLREVLRAQENSDALDGMPRASGDFEMISIGDFRQWFEPGSWDANRPVINERGKELQKIIREHVKGRPPVRRHISVPDNVVPFRAAEEVRRAA